MSQTDVGPEPPYLPFQHSRMPRLNTVGAGGPVRMEWNATMVPVEEELGLGLGWQPVYMPLDRDVSPHGEAAPRLGRLG